MFLPTSLFTLHTIHATTSTTAVTSSSSASTATPAPPSKNVIYVKDEQTGEQKALKICCACPSTRKPRDECVIERGQENCTGQIEAHKQCLRQLGFKI